MRTLVRRTADLLVVVLALVCVVAGSADAALAHFGGGREPSNYRGEITSVSPGLDGVTFRLTDSADRIEIRSTSDIPVIVYGYQHKEPGTRDPYLKVSRDGVWVNTDSQAGYLNRSRFGSGEDIPERLRDDLGDGEPVWEKVSDEGVYRWHDHRIHWMLETPPPAVADDPWSQHQIIRDWKIYVRQGSAPEATVTGQLYWVPPNPWPWWGGALALAVAAFVVGTRWLRAPLAVAVGALGLAAVGEAVVTPLPQDAYQGSFGFVLASASVPALAVAGLCALAVGALRRGADSARYLIGGAAALAALQATSDIPTITRSQLEHSGPAWLVRLIVAAAIGLGVGLLAATIVRSLRTPAASRGSGGVDIASEEEMSEIQAGAPTVGKRRPPPPRAIASDGV